MTNNKTNYQTFVLRFWEEFSADSDVDPSRRFSIGDVSTNQQIGFANADECIQYLQTMLTRSAETN